MDVPGAQTYSLIINLSTVMDQEILPCGQSNPRQPKDFPRLKSYPEGEAREKS